MKTICTIALLSIFSLSPSFADHHQKKTTPVQSSHQKVQSPGGFIAHSFRFAIDDGEPEGGILIEKDGQVVGTISGARAVSFSPTADILLVSEAVASDDLRHYLLDIGKGQYTRKGERKNYVFGSRYVAKAKWSADGKQITLSDFPGISDAAPVTIKVADKLGK